MAVSTIYDSHQMLNLHLAHLICTTAIQRSREDLIGERNFPLTFRKTRVRINFGLLFRNCANIEQNIVK